MRYLAAMTAFLFAALSGCASYIAPRYTPPLPLRDKVQGVKLLEVSGPSALPLCRGAHSVSPPDGMTVPQYIQQGIQHELIRDDPAPFVVATGRLISADFSTAALSPEDMSWSLALELKSADGREETVAVKRSFPPETLRPDDYMHCSLIARQLLPAVQDLAVASAAVLRGWASGKRR